MKVYQLMLMHTTCCQQDTKLLLIAKNNFSLWTAAKLEDTIFDSYFVTFILSYIFIFHFVNLASELPACSKTCEIAQRNPPKRLWLQLHPRPHWEAYDTPTDGTPRTKGCSILSTAASASWLVLCSRR